MIAAGGPERVQDAAEASTGHPLPAAVGGPLQQVAEQQRLQHRRQGQGPAQEWEVTLADWLVEQLHGCTPADVCFNAGRGYAVHVWGLLAESLLPTAAGRCGPAAGFSLRSFGAIVTAFALCTHSTQSKQHVQMRRHRWRQSVKGGLGISELLATLLR